jgi:hypothetical protein
MEDAENMRVSSDQVEQRSLTGNLILGAETTAGGLVVVGAVNQGKKVVAKAVDKIKPKDKD